MRLEDMAAPDDGPPERYPCGGRNVHDASYSTEGSQRRLPRSAWWPTRHAGCRRAVLDSTEPTYGDLGDPATAARPATGS